MRAGPWLEPLRKRRSPFTDSTHFDIDTWRIPVRVEAVPVLEDAGEQALRRPVGGPRTADLDGEGVLAAVAQQLGHLEGVREEIALGVADVGAVEPHVAEVEEALEHEPAAPP